jgi:tripartite-type tricarboxylate transporter receptor subunit TctC
VTTAARSAALPDVPTVADTVPGYESSGWAGVGAPSATPAEIVASLNRAIGEGLADETEKWAKVVKFATLKLG